MVSTIDLRAPEKSPEEPSEGAWVLLEWAVEEGESIQAGQAVAELIDEDGALTIVAPCDGRVREHWVDVGTRLRPGQRLAVLERSESDPPAPDESTGG